MGIPIDAIITITEALGTITLNKARKCFAMGCLPSEHTLPYLIKICTLCLYNNGGMIQYCLSEHIVHG